MTARLGRAGVLLALLYAVVAVATTALSSRPVRPLFDGFAPPVPYNWVNPPPERSGDNTVPKPVERELPLGPEGTDAVNATTEDAQAIVGLDMGSVPPRPPDIAVKVRIVPVDPSTLAPLPAGLRPVSNAYKVELSYVPSQTALAQLARKGTVALTAAEAADKLLFSSDGGPWQERAFRPYGQDNGLFTELETTGYFVAASSVTATATHNSTSRTPRNLLLLLAGIVPIAGAALALRLPSPVRAQEGVAGRTRPRSSSRPAARKKAKRQARRPTKRGRK